MNSHELLRELEKSFFKSKKFIAWFITQLLLSVLAGMALYFQRDLGWPLASFMVSIVTVIGITTMWIIGKQAAADTLIRGLALGKKLDEEKSSSSSTDVQSK